MYRTNLIHHHCVSIGLIPNQGTIESVTLVTFFVGYFEYFYHQPNLLEINLFDSQREYTIANDNYVSARVWIGVEGRCFKDSGRDR
jgi:hypothetical protein